MNRGYNLFPRPRLPRLTVSLALAAGFTPLLAGAGPLVAGASQAAQDGADRADRGGPPDQVTPGPRSNASIARWSPSYTLPPTLPDFDGATSVSVTDTGIWLATESFVSRYHAGVWSPAETLPAAGAIFTLAAAPTGLWAFGFEGGAWRRTASGWTTLPNVSGADFYASTPHGEGAVAVGFDFGSEYGTVIQADPTGVTSTIHDWMYRRQLLAVAATPSGDLWAGGCDYESNLFLMKKGLGEPWEQVAAPAAAGCIHDISFAANGPGLAAAGGAVLGWDGSTWTILTGAPDGGRQWLRVAATLDGPASGAAETAVTGWAVAGSPRWPAFVDPVLGSYFDGVSFSQAKPVAADGGTVGPDQVEAGRSLLAIESDGRAAMAIGRLGSSDAPLPAGGAALMALSPGRVELAHPLLASVEDLAALDAGDVWAAGQGAVGVLHRLADWLPAASGTPRIAERLDFAEPDVGWSLGSFSVMDPVSTTFDASSYWDGLRWSPRPPGSWDAAVEEVRALADGRAWGWGRLRDGVLLERDLDSSWRPVSGAPRLDPPPAAGPPGAPFDVVLSNGRLVGWVDGESGLYRYDNGVFSELAFRESLQVIDLQMVTARNGWALAYDTTGGGGAPRRTKQLFRIVDRDWQRVPDFGLALRGVEWSQVAAASADEAWLLGVGREGGSPWPLLARFDGRWELFGDREDGAGAGDPPPRCSATRLDTSVRRDGTTHVWLGGTTAPCGPTVDGTLRALEEYAGPISLLVVAPVRGNAFLPITHR